MSRNHSPVATQSQRHYGDYVMRNDTRHNSTQSSGADSWRSDETVKSAMPAPLRTNPSKLKTEDRSRNDRDTEISPGSDPPRQYMAYVSPKTPIKQRPADHNGYRKEPKNIETPRHGLPSISRQPPSATMPSWSSSYASGGMPMGNENTFFDDTSDDLQLSPGNRPKNADEYSSISHRRPSVASAHTASSTGSNRSGSRYHKKLNGFFGDEYPGDSWRNGDSLDVAHHPTVSDSPASVKKKAPANASQLAGGTIPGRGSAEGRPASPAVGRPRTPQAQPKPSSEVTPWEFQEPANSFESERRSLDYNVSGSKGSNKSHRLGFAGHKRSGSRDDSKLPDSSSLTSLRTTSSRDDYFSSAGRSLTSGSKTALVGRTASPTPSQENNQTSDVVQRSPAGMTPGTKRGFLDKLRRKDKSDKISTEMLREIPSSTPAVDRSAKALRTPKAEITPSMKRKGTAGAGDFIIAPLPQTPSLSNPRKEYAARIPFKSKKGSAGQETVQCKDPNEAGLGSNEALFSLDTDLSQMEGIVNKNAAPVTPPVGGIGGVAVASAGGGAGEIFAGWPDDAVPKKDSDPQASWDAPDSWAVKRVNDENVARLREIGENGTLLNESDGPSYSVRMYRNDSTYTTLSVGLNTTVAEIIAMLGKKSLLVDELANYQIVLKKGDTSRQLEPGERPLVIQKRLLEQVGYTSKDHIEEIGRDENSYLCRFTFLLAKMSGYSTMNKDIGFGRAQKFSHIDLSGRNLITIPIALYQKSLEIISLNLSRNLSLDVPKDFVQSCTNLRDIKYASNEAWRLPPSFSLATSLTSLDVSNNQLEQLASTELYKLSKLLSLRLSNNRLMSVPDYFVQFRALRTLNLSSNSLREFPDHLCDLTTLVDLDISFNAISSIPRIGDLKNLDRLIATNNRIKGTFSQSLKDLVNLREIDLRFNAIANIDIMAQLPRLETLLMGHNSVSSFEGSFTRLHVLNLNHNPITRFNFSAPVPSLTVLNLASAKLAQLPDDMFQKVPGLTKLILDKNHFVSLSPQIGNLLKLEYLSVAKNGLNTIPPEIGRLLELRHLDVRDNSLGSLPQEIWHARRLETLNVSSNVLDTFPKPGASLPAVQEEQQQQQSKAAALQTSGLSSAQSSEETLPSDSYSGAPPRRPSQSSGYVSTSSSPHSTRKGSISSTYTSGPRKPSLVSRVNTDATMTSVTRKDSNLANKFANTFAVSLRHIFLADNRLSDDVFEELAMMPELRIVNLSYNELYDIPPRTIRRWPHLAELYLSGNDLTSLPAEDLEEVSSLKVLHINSNKFQVLPAELGKVQKLAVLDVSSNNLKYNVANWPYDWNWNWNRNLKYLSLSANKRLEIKPSGSYFGSDSRDGTVYTDFTSLTNLRILGLMDVTLMVPSVPDQSEDRRVRTAGSTIGSMSYGMADSLGRNEHLSTFDMVIPRFRSHDDQTIFGMFDGQALSSGGSKIAKFLYENFKDRFHDELEQLSPNETPCDALRRTYLTLNRDIAYLINQPNDPKLAEVPLHHTQNSSHRPSLSGLDMKLTESDLTSGSVATVLFLQGTTLFVSNVGNAQALLVHTEGSHRVITRKHDPAEPTERLRIKEAGGYVSRQGKLNDSLDVSRAFGYVHMIPAVMAAPHVSSFTIGDNDEMVIIASQEIWEYLTPDFAVDVARSERGDLMRAAHKLRDIAIAFGATGKITVMIIGVSDLRRREMPRYRAHNMSMDPSGSPGEIFAGRKPKRLRNIVGDSKLARLDQEVEAPTGEVSLVFTDIKNSTLLWETNPTAMRSAIKMHNELMRRQLRIIGGYEVKTEGDAFMVAFPAVTSALLWCFSVQSQLLTISWPQEILDNIHGQEVMDDDGTIIYRGLSVRMGIHWGCPVCETDPVTKRMDYFGPMVNRAARISSVADGGQITVSSDFIAEIQRLVETYTESDHNPSLGSEDGMHNGNSNSSGGTDEPMTQQVCREIRSLITQGYEVKDLGERRLKGLENPEYIYLMYPFSLAGRQHIQQQRAKEAEAAAAAAAAEVEAQAKAKAMASAEADAKAAATAPGAAASASAIVASNSDEKQTPIPAAGGAAGTAAKDAAGTGVHSRAGSAEGKFGIRSRQSQILVDLDSLRQLFGMSVRLEMLCSTLEGKGATGTGDFDPALRERMKESLSGAGSVSGGGSGSGAVGDGEVNKRLMLEHLGKQVARLENSPTVLALKSASQSKERRMHDVDADGVDNDDSNNNDDAKKHNSSSNSSNGDNRATKKSPYPPMADLFAELDRRVEEVKAAKAVRRESA